MEVKIAKSWIEQAIGLMFRDKQIMIFPFKTYKKTLVNTFFMKYPINIYYFDNNYKVIRVTENLMPYYIDIDTYCNGFVEVPTDHKTKLKVGIDIRKVLNIDNT